MAVTFESMERRMPKIEKCLAEYGIRALTHMISLKAYSQSHSRMPAGLTHSAVQ